MAQTVRIALPVPAPGHAIGDEGDAYVASLLVEITVDGQVLARVDGTSFEALITAARYRHLAFHPRTRALTAGSVKGPALAAALERHWSAIDSSAREIPGLVELAEGAVCASRRGRATAWRQVN